jgi:hypothetical protein
VSVGAVARPTSRAAANSAATSTRAAIIPAGERSLICMCAWVWSSRAPGSPSAC